MEAYDIPDELVNYQALDMNKIGFVQDLIRGVKKVLGTDKTVEANQTTAASATVVHTASTVATDALLKRIFIFLEDGEWKQANEYCERVLDTDPENAKAYIGKLCAELKIKSETDLQNCKKPLDNSQNYQKALRFADTNYRTKVFGYNQAIKERVQEEQRRLEEERREEQRRLEEEQRRQEEERRIKYEEQYKQDEERRKQEAERDKIENTLRAQRRRWAVKFLRTLCISRKRGLKIHHGKNPKQHNRQNHGR
jgi:flagellar biosynthesis GTPase FlhF